MSIYLSQFVIRFIKYFGLRDTFCSVTSWNSTKHLKLVLSLQLINSRLQCTKLKQSVLFYAQHESVLFMLKNVEIFSWVMSPFYINYDSLTSEKMHILAIMLQLPAATLFIYHVGKIILYMYYKTNLCLTQNIIRLIIMIMFKILF